MYAMVAVRALARSKERVGFSRGAGMVWHCFDVHLPHILFVVCTIAHRELLNSVRSDQHVGVMTTQQSLVSTAHTRDAKQIKSLASRLDAMRRNPKF